MKSAQIRRTEQKRGVRIIGNVLQTDFKRLQAESFCSGEGLPYPFDAERVRGRKSRLTQGEKRIIHLVEDPAEGRAESCDWLGVFFRFESVILHVFYLARARIVLCDVVQAEVNNFCFSRVQRIWVQGQAAWGALDASNKQRTFD